MRFLDTLREKYNSIDSNIQEYNEPHRTNALRWLNIAKLALGVVAVDMIGISIANVAIGFEEHQEALQHTLGNVQVYGFAGSLALGLTAVAGIASAERQSRSN